MLVQEEGQRISQGFLAGEEHVAAERGICNVCSISNGGCSNVLVPRKEVRHQCCLFAGEFCKGLVYNRFYRSFADIFIKTVCKNRCQNAEVGNRQVHLFRVQPVKVQCVSQRVDDIIVSGFCLEHDVLACAEFRTNEAETLCIRIYEFVDSKLGNRIGVLDKVCQCIGCGVNDIIRQSTSECTNFRSCCSGGGAGFYSFIDQLHDLCRGLDDNRQKVQNPGQGYVAVRFKEHTAVTLGSGFQNGRNDHVLDECFP